MRIRPTRYWFHHKNGKDLYQEQNNPFRQLRPADVVIFFHGAKVRVYSEYGVQFGAPCPRWMLRNWKESTGSTKMTNGIQHVTQEEQQREIILFSLAKRRLRGNLIPAYNYLNMCFKDDRIKLFFVEAEGKTRGRSH